MNPPMSENFLTPTPETIQAESQPVTGSGKGAHCYRVFGLRIASALPLRNLATLLDTSGADADVNIHITAPEEIPDREGRPQFDVDGNGVTLTMHGTARYRVEAGQRVTVTPHHSASERKIVLFLLGSVIGIICHQRRLMPLHASAILVNGRAIAFCGHSGIGKSTLVSHLAARGHAMLCDDVCVVSLDATHRPHAFPGLPTARSGHAVAYDAARGRVVLFAGYAAGDARRNDTWEWDGSAWTERTPPAGSPTARSGHAMAYDLRGDFLCDPGETAASCPGDCS